MHFRKLCWWPRFSDRNRRQELELSKGSTQHSQHKSPVIRKLLPNCQHFRELWLPVVCVFTRNLKFQNDCYIWILWSVWIVNHNREKFLCDFHSRIHNENQTAKLNTLLGFARLFEFKVFIHFSIEKYPRNALFIGYAMQTLRCVRKATAESIHYWPIMWLVI